MRFLVPVMLLGLASVVAAQTPDTYVETIEGTAVQFDMVRVPGGVVTTAAGDIEVAPFWISRTEVLWDLYDVYVFGLDRPANAGGADAVARPTRPYVLPGEGFGHAGRPAIGMTHHAATQFVAWLSAKTGRVYRLPTEAEWTLACRAGGTESSPASAWTRANADARTHPPGALAANSLGIHDLVGNVAEWIEGADGRPAAAGGAFDDEPANASCAARRHQTPAWNATDPQLPKSRWWLPDAPFVGIRLVAEG